MICDLPYIHLQKKTKNIEKDVKNLLLLNGHNNTAMHCKKVAKTCVELAKKFNLDETIAYNAGILHDISIIIKPNDMLNYAENNNWYIDESEKKYHFILHQRISKIIAEDYFNIDDNNILSAIACHTTLKYNPSKYDMLLFIADKLSWDQEGFPPFYDVMKKALEQSLIKASLTYIEYIVNNKMILLPHKWLTEARSWLINQCCN